MYITATDRAQIGELHDRDASSRASHSPSQVRVEAESILYAPIMMKIHVFNVKRDDVMFKCVSRVTRQAASAMKPLLTFLMLKRLHKKFGNALSVGRQETDQYAWIFFNQPASFLR